MSDDGAFSETVLLQIMPVGLYFRVMWTHANKTSAVTRVSAENIVVEVFVLWTDSLYQLDMFLTFPALCCSTYETQIIVKWHFGCLLTSLYLKLTQCDMQQA